MRSGLQPHLLGQQQPQAPTLPQEVRRRGHWRAHYPVPSCPLLHSGPGCTRPPHHPAAFKAFTRNVVIAEDFPIIREMSLILEGPSWG